MPVPRRLRPPDHRGGMHPADVPQVSCWAWCAHASLSPTRNWSAWSRRICGSESISPFGVRSSRGGRNRRKLSAGTSSARCRSSSGGGRRRLPPGPPADRRGTMRSPHRRHSLAIHPLACDRHTGDPREPIAAAFDRYFAGRPHGGERQDQYLGSTKPARSTARRISHPSSRASRSWSP